MAAREDVCCVTVLEKMFLKLIFICYFSSICATESTVYTGEEGNKSADNGTTLSTTVMYSPVQNTLFTGNVYGNHKQSNDDDTHCDKATPTSNKAVRTSSDSNVNYRYIYSNQHTNDNHKTMRSTSENVVSNLKEQSDINWHTENSGQSFTNSSNNSEDNSINQTLHPTWSCSRYNLSHQSVIILKNKSSLIWWLDELNKTASCAVVLFYAKWCYFSASLAPIYNAVGRAFSGIPVLAIDAYTHNSLNTRYGIVGVPTIILFQESRPVARFNRSRTFNDLVEFIHKSTGMEYNSSIEVSIIDYEEGPLASSPSQEFNFHLFASICFLFILGLLALWRMQYLQIIQDYFMSLTLIRQVLNRIDREKND